MYVSVFGGGFGGKPFDDLRIILELFCDQSTGTLEVRRANVVFIIPTRNAALIWDFIVGQQVMYICIVGNRAFQEEKQILLATYFFLLSSLSRQ